MKEEKYLCKMPIIDCLQKINDIPSNSIFLCGKEGSGKTTIENYLIRHNNFLNLTLMYEDKRNYLNNKIYNLYYIALIISKIIINLLMVDPSIKLLINNYQLKINNILNYLEENYLAYNNLAFLYTKPDINSNILNNPEILVVELVNLIKDKIDIKTLKFIIDDFDLIKNNAKYESVIYNSLDKYFKVVYIINDNVKLKEKIDNKLIKINYSEDIEIVRDILDRYTIYRGLIPSDKLNLRLNFIFQDEDIQKLIKKTDGNIIFMKYIIFNFYTTLLSNSENMNYAKLFEEALKIKLDTYKKLKRTFILN